MGGSPSSPWGRRALHLLLAGLLVPIVIAAVRSGAQQEAPAGPALARPSPLWRHGRAFDLAPDASAGLPVPGGLAPLGALPPLGPTPGTPSLTPPPSASTSDPSAPFVPRPDDPGLTAALDTRPHAAPTTELALPGTDLAEAAADRDLPGERLPGFMQAPESQDGSATGLGRLADRIVGGASPDSLGRNEKLQAARLFLAAGRYADAWRLYETEQPSRLGRDLTLEAVMVAIGADRAGDGFAWLGDTPLPQDDRSAYWWARLAQLAGRDDLAHPVFEGLAGRTPRGYYGVWAAARLRGAGRLTSPVTLDGRATREDQGVPSSAVALVELADLAHRHGAALPQLERALTFARAGSSIAADQELRTAFKQRPGTFNRADTASVARVARMLGDEELALRIEQPEELREYHRHAWRDLVIAAAARHEVDPDLVWSVMLRESYFRPNAASPVGAIGLMQIMPETGRAIARLQRMTGFHAQDLLDPDCAIDFGAFLLGGLLRRYDGNVTFALAAYNAGIGPTDEWVGARRGAEGDLFCELIPYPETHRYVQRVLTSLALYQTAL